MSLHKLQPRLILVLVLFFSQPELREPCQSLLLMLLFSLRESAKHIQDTTFERRTWLRISWSTSEFPVKGWGNLVGKVEKERPCCRSIELLPVASRFCGWFEALDSAFPLPSPSPSPRTEFPKILPITTNHAHWIVYWIHEDVCLCADRSACGYKTGDNYVAKRFDMHPVTHSCVCIGQGNKNCVTVSLSTSAF